ncbi:MAG TPA: hypothetical protein VHS99_26975 [Chloroflexota bacterium]|nr:hypothetical protein [Chloroflexota bacterium]
MARLNISLPDPLYARLERLRDRVNASKVCAAALEKELNMVEGRPPAPGISDAQIDRLVERLRGARDRWYERGRQDGVEWAVGRASVAELEHIGEEWEDDDNYDLDDDDLPESFDLWDTLARWEGHEALEEDGDLKAAYLRGWHYAVRDIWRAAKPRLR